MEARDVVEDHKFPPTNLMAFLRTFAASFSTPFLLVDMGPCAPHMCAGKVAEGRAGREGT